MNKTTKTHLLTLIADEDLAAAIEQLTAALPEDHPQLNRTKQLGIRYRELQERKALGTLNNDDITRVRARISGGLRDIIREVNAVRAPAASTPPPTDKPTFKLDLSQSKPEKPATATSEKGFRGEIDYTGSPTKKEQTVTLHKGYGAAYHTAREAIRKAGLEMVRGDRDGGTLEAKLAPTGTGGYGEKILLWLTPVDGGTTKIHAVVDSQLPTLTFDLGRNKTKLGILVSYLR